MVFAAVLKISLLMVCKEIDHASPKPGRRAAPATRRVLQLPLPLSPGCAVHLPRMRPSDHCSKKTSHLLRFAFRKVLFEVALIAEMATEEHVGVDVAPDFGELGDVADFAVEVGRWWYRDIDPDL